MKKTAVFLLACFVLSAIAFGFSIEIGGGIETFPIAASLWLPAVSAGIHLPIGDNFGITGDVGAIMPLAATVLGGLRYTFGSPDDFMRLYAGADGGVLNSYGATYPIAGVNGGANFKFGTFGLYAETAYRFMMVTTGGVTSAPITVVLPLFELTGGVTLNF